MKTIAKYSVFLVVGLVVGSGSFGLGDWQWWALVIVTNLAIFVRDWAMGHNIA